MLEALAGGALFRLAPEILKDTFNFLDRKAARKHEIAMAEQARETAKVQGDSSVAVAQYNAMQTSYAQPLTGIKLVDGANASMRWLITFVWVIVLNPLAIIAKCYALTNSGMSMLHAIDLVWGDRETAIVMAIIGYWFVDRTLRNYAK